MTTEQLWATIVASLATAAATYAPHFIALIGLAFIDVATGVASALKRKQFDWTRAGDFYRSDLAPKVLGWLGTTLGLAIVTPVLPALGDQSAAITAIGSYSMFTGAVVSLVASIAENVKEIRA